MEIDKSNLSFDQLSEQYFTQLESTYLEKVEESANKQYAKAYYRAVIFERNPRLPKDSFFFETLTATFLHYYRLSHDKEDALLTTFDNLYKIKERAEQELLDTLEYFKSEPASDNELFALQLMAEKENNLLSLEFHEIHDLLALFLVTRKLLEKYPKDNNVEPFNINAPLEDPSELPKVEKSKKHEYTVIFTERQQMLALYFLMQQLGFRESRDYNKTDIARFAHLLSKQPITKLDNSGKYQITKRLFSEKSAKQNLKDLEFILPFFKTLDLQTAINLITSEINELQKDS